MTSVLKVDNIQTSSGSAPNAATLGFEAGSVVKTTLFPAIGRVSITQSAAYSNNRANYDSLGSSYKQDVTVRTANPILLITGAILISHNNSSHSYFDFYVSGTPITDGWLSEKIETTTKDGLVTNHMEHTSDKYPLPIHAAWETSLSAGDTINFDPQVAVWSLGNPTRINQWRDGNNNQDMITRFICQEIAT